MWTKASNTSSIVKMHSKYDKIDEQNDLNFFFSVHIVIYNPSVKLTKVNFLNSIENVVHVYFKKK